MDNRIEITGKVVRDFKLTYIDGKGGKHFTALVEVPRDSGTVDTLPVKAAEDIIGGKEWLNEAVRVIGWLRSRNTHYDGKSHVELSVEAYVFEKLEEVDELGTNVAELTGYLCRVPSKRETPLGKTIADFVVAVNRPEGGSDYIPTICWWKTAEWVSNLSVGTKIILYGRFQSRDYNKTLDDGTVITKTAYELSAGKIVRIRDQEKIQDAGE